MGVAYLLSAFLMLAIPFFCSDSLHGRTVAKKMLGVLQNKPELPSAVIPAVMNAFEKTVPHLNNLPAPEVMNVVVQVNTTAQENNVGVNPLQFEEYKKLFASGKTSITNGITKFFDYITNNKKVAIAGGIAGCYVALQATLVYLNYQLNKETCWSLWRGKKAKNFSQNPEDKKNRFGKRLLNDIQQAYTNSNDPTDFVSPLTLFMHDTERERKRLKLYQQLTKVIEILHIKRFFFYDQKLVKNVPERLQDLASYRKTFLSWLGMVKVNQAKGMPNQDFQLRAFRSTMRSESKKRNLSYLQQPSA